MQLGRGTWCCACAGISARPARPCSPDASFFQGDWSRGRDDWRVAGLLGGMRRHVTSCRRRTRRRGADHGRQRAMHGFLAVRLQDGRSEQFESAAQGTGKRWRESRQLRCGAAGDWRIRSPPASPASRPAPVASLSHRCSTTTCHRPYQLQQGLLHRPGSGGPLHYRGNSAGCTGDDRRDLTAGSTDHRSGAALAAAGATSQAAGNVVNCVLTGTGSGTAGNRDPRVSMPVCSWPPDGHWHSGSTYPSRKNSCGSRFAVAFSRDFSPARPVLLLTDAGANNTTPTPAAASRSGFCFRRKILIGRDKMPAAEKTRWALRGDRCAPKHAVALAVDIAPCAGRNCPRA